MYCTISTSKNPVNTYQLQWVIYSNYQHERTFIYLPLISIHCHESGMNAIRLTAITIIQVLKLS